MMEGLGRMMKDVSREGDIRGLQLHEVCLAIMHQQFVYDTMLHCNLKLKEAVSFKSILDNFATTSIMEINHSKSMIFF